MDGPARRVRITLPLALISMAALASLAGCGGSSPPPKVAPPPAFAFDEATTKAASDPKYAPFIALCEARKAADKAFRDFAAAHPMPRSAADQARFTELREASRLATIAANKAINADGLSAEDRKVMRYLLGTRGS